MTRSFIIVELHSVRRAQTAVGTKTVKGYSQKSNSLKGVKISKLV